MFKYTKILQNFLTILSFTHKNYISTFRSIPIELLEQKSHVSEVIIQEILKKRSFDEIKECTLTERIKRRVKSCDNVDQNVKEEMLDFFTDGVVSNREIFSEEVHEKQIFEPSLEPDSYKIRFFPTTFMTQKVFYHLLNNPEKRLQIVPQGVGFSISLQLYCTLSNIIHQYRCEKNKPTGKFKPLFENVTKVLFWNVNDKDEYNQMREKIQSQCPQLANGNFIKQGRNSRSHFYRYNSNSEVIFFFDHMYRLVNQRRGIQFYKTKIDKIKYKQQTNQELTPKQLEFYQTKIKKKELFSKSSVCIASNVSQVAYEKHQQKLASAHFSIWNLNDRILRYQYDRHTSVYCNKYQYEEIIPCEDTIIEMIDYFLFELKQKIHLPIFSQGNWNDPELVVKVRNQIRSQLPQNPFIDLIITPLGISNSLKTFWKSSEKELLEVFQKLIEIHAAKKSQVVWIQKVANQVLKLLYRSMDFMKSEFEKEIGEFADELNIEEKLIILRAQIMSEKIEIDRQGMSEQKLEQDEIEKLKVLRVKSNKLKEHYLSPFIKKPAYMIDYQRSNTLLQNCIEKRIFYNLQQVKSQRDAFCYYSTGYLMKILQLSMDDIFQYLYKRHLSNDDETQAIKKLEQQFKSVEDNIEKVEKFVHRMKEDKNGVIFPLFLE